MDNLENLKIKFLNGEISALEYEKMVAESPIKEEKIDIKPVKFISFDVFIIGFLLVLFTLLVIIYVSPNLKPTEKIKSSNIVPAKTKTQIAKEDSINKIEIEKRRQEELLEESKFLKTKAGRIYKKHPEWSKEDCKSLADNRIWIGMSIDMLKYNRGLPNSANPSNYGNGVTQWQWCWTDYTPSCFYDDDGDGLIDSYN
jgi:hypothetical protein